VGRQGDRPPVYVVTARTLNTRSGAGAENAIGALALQ